jgi:branched-chain amino acid transport system permease protein
VNAPQAPSIGRRAAVAGAVLAALALVPAVASTYQTQLLTYGLTLAIAALGFNLLLGYTGLLSFGHSAYLGAGAYAVAFMMRYLDVASMELFLLGGIAFSAVLAALFGFVCVRHTRIFFAILTLALSQVLWTLAYKFFWITGGTDGIRVPFAKLTLLGGLVGFPGADAFPRFITSYYYYVLAVFAACVVLMWLIVHSPFGKTLQAIRDNETRARFLGVRIWRYRWLAFVLSGIFTGLAGTLWVPLNGLTTPDVLYWPQSGKIVFFAVLGGFRNFSGPIVGAVIFNYLEVYAVALTEYWQITLGVILIVLVTFLPAGIVGTAVRLGARLKRGAEAAA